MALLVGLVPHLIFVTTTEYLTQKWDDPVKGRQDFRPHRIYLSPPLFSQSLLTVKRNRERYLYDDNNNKENYEFTIHMPPGTPEYR
jgi:hypothetical protein